MSHQSNEFLTPTLRRLVIIAGIALFVFAVWSAMEARKLVTNRVGDWMPQGTPEIRDFIEHFYPHFPEGEMLMIAWKGCEVNDERIDRVAEKLLAPPDAESETPLYKSVITTRSALAELGDTPGINSQHAKLRLQGWLIGKNGKDACVIAVIQEKQDRTAAVKYAYHVVETITGSRQPDIYIAGPTIDSVAIDEIAAASQKTILPFFLFFCVALLCLCLRNFFAAGIVFFVAMINGELGIALLYWTNAHIDSISMLITTLTYVLTISGGIHLLNYYRETLHETDELCTPQITLRKAIVPCTLAAVTTVLGLGSLGISRMIPIRNFGIYSSLALIFGTVIMFVFILSVLQQHPIKVWRQKAVKNPTETFHHRLGLFWESVGDFVYRYRRFIVIVSALLLIFFAWECGHLKTTVTFHGMMSKNSKVIQDYNHLENTIGGLIPVEVMLQIPDRDGAQPPILEQLYWLGTVRDSLNGIEGVGAIISVLNFLPNIPAPTESGLAATSRRSALASILQRAPQRLNETRFYDRSDTDNATFWRLSLRTYAQVPIDYAQLLDEISKRLETVRNDLDTDNADNTDNKNAGKRFDYYVTGGVPLAHRAQQQLLSDLINSFLTAFILIALSLIILLRGIIQGLLAMVPNIFPCVLVFGAMGYWGLPVDIGSMMTASVAMGISVDGTLHFLTWLQHALKEGADRKTAVVMAYRRCATALTQTTIICGFGILIFASSGFIPVSRFAVLLCLLLSASLIGDIIILPALLFVRFGKFFEPRKQYNIF